MKKKILGIAAAIVAFVAINASAQNNATNYCNNNCNNNCTPEAQCQNPTKCKKDKKEWLKLYIPARTAMVLKRSK